MKRECWPTPKVRKQPSIFSLASLWKKEHFLLSFAHLIISNECPLTLQREGENNSVKLFSSQPAAIQEHMNRKIASSTSTSIILRRERILPQKISKAGTKTSKKEVKKEEINWLVCFKIRNIGLRKQIFRSYDFILLRVLHLLHVAFNFTFFFRIIKKKH